jgi:hypothetical protein
MQAGAYCKLELIAAVKSFILQAPAVSASYFFTSVGYDCKSSIKLPLGQGGSILFLV